MLVNEIEVLLYGMQALPKPPLTFDSLADQLLHATPS